MKRLLGWLAFFALMAGEVALLRSCDQGFEERKAAKAQRMIDRGCVLSGYYGRSGEYKTYNCNGWILKEDEI